MTHRNIYFSIVLLGTVCICLLAFRLIHDTKTYFWGSTVVVRRSENVPYDYLLHFPKHYHDFYGKRPLIIYLHGAGEVGKDVTILKEFAPCCFTNQMQNNLNFPFLVVSPMNRTYRWEPKDVVLLLDTLLKDERFRYEIDSQKVYLTGFSMGGFGTFDVACEYPDRFAAIVPLAGGCDPTKAKQLQTVPIWTFHGDADKVVDYECTKKIMDAIDLLNHADVKFTTLYHEGHGIPHLVYRRPDLYEWLLNHSSPHPQER